MPTLNDNGPSLPGCFGLLLFWCLVGSPCCPVHGVCIFCFAPLTRNCYLLRSAARTTLSHLSLLATIDSFSQQTRFPTHPSIYFFRLCAPLAVARPDSPQEDHITLVREFNPRKNNPTLRLRVFIPPTVYNGFVVWHTATCFR